MRAPKPPGHVADDAHACVNRPSQKSPVTSPATADENETRVRCVDRAVIGDAFEVCFLDGDGSIVRSSQRTDRDAETEPASALQ